MIWIMLLLWVGTMMVLNWIQLAVLMYLKRGWQCCVKGLLKSIPQLRFFSLPDGTVKNFAGSDAEKVVDAMIEVCGNYSIPIFDSARKGGIYASNDHFRKIYFQNSKNNTDTAHLNEKGHERFLKVAESFILQY